jgi:Putative zinc dependent peptidase (DUF5700)
MAPVQSYNSRIFLFTVAAAVCFGPGEATAARVSNMNVQMVADEADAVLRILAEKESGRAISEEDWKHLFASEGYVRLKKREDSMKRSFSDADFERFVLSTDLAAKAPQLRVTLERWKQADIRGAGQHALAYLPSNARIRAKIYPVIKPRTNSFVFEADSDPAIFLYLDPDESKDRFENTVAHELHHIGYANACPAMSSNATGNQTDKPVATVLQWIGAFGEGWAMLAAAGGPDVHPHQYSKPEDRTRWDRDVARMSQDLQEVQSFFLDVLNQKLKTEEEIQQKAFSFFGVQGPWYTIGWQMAVTIERQFGRPALIDCICDRKRFLVKYNEAATRWNQSSTEKLPLWSEDFLSRIGAVAPSPAGVAP